MLRSLCVVLALSSFAFHALIDHQSSVTNQWIGAGLLSACVLLALGLFGMCRDASPNNPSSIWGPRYYPFLIVGLLVAPLFLWDLESLPMWSEEARWTEQARRIVHGEMIHPIGTIGDHPANFSAWFCALILALTGDPLFATRFPSVVFSYFTVYFAVGTSAVLVPGGPLFWRYLLGFLSVTLIYFSGTGWNEMTIAPCLVAIQMYFVARVIVSKSARGPPGLGISAGFGFWTLYSSFLSAAVALATVLCAPNRWVLGRSKITMLLVFLLVASPVLGKMVRDPMACFSRHERFLQGGEWGKQFGGEYRPLPTYIRTIRVLAERMVPNSDLVGFQQLQDGRLEIVVFGLLIVGLVWLPLTLGWSRRIALFVPACGTLAGLILSNPEASPWRTFCIFPFELVIAISVLGCLSRVLKGHEYLYHVLVAGLVISHVALFGLHYHKYRAALPDHRSGGAEARLLWNEIREPIAEGYRFAAVGGWTTKFIDLAQRESPTAISFGSLKMLYDRISPGRWVILWTKEAESTLPLRKFEAAMQGKFSSLPVRPISDPRGRLIGAVAEGEVLPGEPHAGE